MKLEGYSNYEIYPETGQIFSYKQNKYIDGWKDSKGYQRVNLWDDNNIKKQWKVHRLIYTAIYGGIPEGMQVNHINEDKSDNRICNLNLMTPKENVNWGTRNERASIGISKALKGRKFTEQHKYNLSKSKGKSVCMLQNGKLLNVFYSTRNAEEIMGFNHSLISNCCNGKYQQHKGYQWQYMDNYLADWWEQEMDKAV